MSISFFQNSMLLSCLSAIHQSLEENEIVFLFLLSSRGRNEMFTEFLATLSKLRFVFTTDILQHASENL